MLGKVRSFKDGSRIRGIGVGIPGAAVDSCIEFSIREDWRWSFNDDNPDKIHNFLAFFHQQFSEELAATSFNTTTPEV